MGLFDALKGNKSNNYAQKYKEAVEEGNHDKSFKVLEQWGEVPSRFDDSNFLLVMAVLNASTDHPKSDIEMYLKKYKMDSRPVDSSLASWYRMLAVTILKAKNHDDLVSQYL